MKINRLICLLLFLVASPCYAQEALFTSEVMVDTIGKDPAEARTLGLKKASRDGFGSLLEKFAPDLKVGILEDTTDDAIAALVHSQEPNNERVDGNRYRADVRVNFLALKFNALIEKRLADVKDDKVLKHASSLVLPIWFEGDTPVLFHPKNRWRQAWETSGIAHKTGQIVLPYGDSIDISLILPDKALTQGYTEFVPLLRRYGARDVVILAARLQEKPYAALDVVLRRVQPKHQEITRHRVQGDPEETSNSVLHDATLAMAEEILKAQGGTLDALKNRDNPAGVQLLVVSITTPKRYSDFLKKLRSLPQVQRLDIVALNATQADLKVMYTDTPEKLIEAIKGYGVRVTEWPGYWTVEELL